MSTKTKALLYIFAAAFCFSLMNMLAKIVGQRGIPYLEIAFARAFIGLILVTGYMLATKQSFKINNRRALGLRVVFGVSAMFAVFYSLTHMPLAESVTLFNTRPIFIALLGWLWLKEKPTIATMTSIALAFIGVWFIFAPSTKYFMTSMLALYAGIAMAIAMLALRKLGESDQALPIIFHFSLWASIATLVCGASDFQMPDLVSFVLLFLMGVIVTIAQVLMTWAYALTQAAFVGAGGSIAVVCSALLGFFYFNEPLSLPALLGITLIVISMLGLLLQRTRREPTR